MANAGGVVRVFNLPIASGATFSTYSQQIGNGYQSVYLEVMTMPSNFDIYINVANSAAGTYRRIRYVTPNTASVQSTDFVIGSAASNRMVAVPAGFDFYKVEVSTAMTAATSFNLICA